MPAYLRLAAFPEVPVDAAAAAGARPGLAPSSRTASPPCCRPPSRPPASARCSTTCSASRPPACYKPDPRVYALATARFGMQPGEMAFISSNPWDAFGAHEFGFRVFWVNRSGLPDEYGLRARIAELPDLAVLPDLADVTPAARIAARSSSCRRSRPRRAGRPMRWRTISSAAAASSAAAIAARCRTGSGACCGLRRRLGWWLARLGLDATPRLLVAASLLLEGWVFSGVLQAFSGGRFAPPALNRAEQAGLRKAGRTHAGTPGDARARCGSNCRTGSSRACSRASARRSARRWPPWACPRRSICGSTCSRATATMRAPRSPRRGSRPSRPRSRPGACGSRAGGR